MAETAVIEQPTEQPAEESSESQESTENEAENSEPQVDEAPATDATETDVTETEETSESSDDNAAAKQQGEQEESTAAQDREAEGNSNVSVEDESSEEIEVEPPKQEEPKPDEEKDPKVEKSKKEKCIIGATATLLEKQTGLKFRARVDSGAKSCSLHVEKISIENESTKTDPAERMTENTGKVITFVVKNGEGKTQPIKRKIAGYVIIKNSNKKEGVRRYKVPMTFLWKNMEKEVLVTLNNRKHMEYPLLLGRNFLRGDFLVDVELNSDD